MFYNGLQGRRYAGMTNGRDIHGYIDREPHGTGSTNSTGYHSHKSNEHARGRQMNNNKGRKYDTDADDSDSAPSIDSTGKRKSFRRLITRFAEKTSMQGVPYINNAKLLGAKIIWSVLLVAAMVALGIHLWFLITQYYEWPVQTKIELGYSNLRFPDVTICNTNPIHKGRFDQLENAKALKQLINDLNPRNLVPDQFDPNFDPLNPTNQQPPDSNPPDNAPLPTTLAPNDQSNGPTNGPTTSAATTGETANPPPNTNTQATTQQSNTQPAGPTPQLITTAPPGPGSNTQSNTDPPSTSATTLPATNRPDNQTTRTSRSTRLPLNTTRARDNQTNSGPTSQTPPQVRKRRFVDEYTGLNLTAYNENFQNNAPEDLTANEYDGEMSTEAEIQEIFEDLYMDLPRDTRATIGHNISDMLLSCTFNGRICDRRQFLLHQTSDYGSCWVLSSNNFIVQSSGPSGGLTLILYLEVQEYLKGLTTGYGTRIQIHEPSTIPYPAEEGLFIPSSMETDIGLKMTLIDRIDGNYGTCATGVTFNEEYKRIYTRRACQRLCEMRRVISQCTCFSDQHEEIALARDAGLRPCRSTKEKDCEKRVLREFNLKTSGCDCPNPCHEIQYTRSISSRQWPNDDYARVLLQSICASNAEVCATLRNDIDDQRVLNNNFLKLTIYYEDLNFQNITEEPEIELAQFLSDVGGAVGLWIGLSILSFCEIIQLIVELFDYFVHRTIKRRDQERRRASRRSHMNDDNKHKDGDTNKHKKASGDQPKSHTSHDLDRPLHDLERHPGRNSPRSSPRLLGVDGRHHEKRSPLAERRMGHINDMRGYDSDHARRGSADARYFGNDPGRGLRYNDDDYFRRNYKMGYS